MAHYAFLDENKVVIEVIVGVDECEQAVDWEEHYSQFRGHACKRTSYNTHGGVHRHGGTPFRKNYAGIGFVYDDQRDAFVPPQPFASWVLNEQSCLWHPPVPMPNDEHLYEWDESTYEWIKI